MTFELHALEEAIEEWSNEIRSKFGKFALVALAAELRVMGELDPHTVEDFIRFNRTVEMIMKQVNQAEREYRVDILGDLDRQRRERDEALEDFGAIVEGRNLR